MLWWTLRQLRSKDFRKRARAAEKLGEAKDARAVEALIKALNDQVPKVRVKAAEALGRTGDMSAVEPLVAVFGNGHWPLRTAAARALNTLGWQPSDDTGRALNAAALEQWDEVVIMGPVSIKALEIMLEDRYSPAPKEALESMVRIGEPAVGLLVSVLNDNRDRETRRLACAALSRIGGARATDALVVAIKDFEVNQESIAALVRMGSPAVDPLIAALRHKDSRVRAGVAEALGKIGVARAVESLKATLKDTDKEVREAAAKALAPYALAHKEINHFLQQYKTGEFKRDQTEKKRLEQEESERRARIKEQELSSCTRCEAALQWWSKKTIHGAGIKVASLQGQSEIGQKPADFAGVCSACRKAFCIRHAPDKRCRVCARSLQD